MSDAYLVVAIIAMAAVTFITRALPALMPRRYLDQPWLHRLNERLPLAVLTLLIITSLAYSGLMDSHSMTIHDPSQLQLLLSQIGALATVLLIYHFSRQLLLSMVVGIAALNALLWLLG